MLTMSGRLGRILALPHSGVFVVNQQGRRRTRRGETRASAPQLVGLQPSRLAHDLNYSKEPYCLRRAVARAASRCTVISFSVRMPSIISPLITNVGVPFTL